METETLIQRLESDILKTSARPFDIYVLPAFCIVYAMRSKKGMSRLARRMLFTAGVYMGYRNYAEYKKALAGMREYLQRLKAGT